MNVTIAAVLFALGFMGGDILSGLLKAAKEQDISSSKFRAGLWHKSGFIGLIGLAFGIQAVLSFLELGFTFPAVPIICALIIACEIISIYENLCVLNPQLKEKRFSQLFAEVPTEVNIGKHEQGNKL